MSLYDDLKKKKIISEDGNGNVTINRTDEERARIEQRRIANRQVAQNFRGQEVQSIWDRVTSIANDLGNTGKNLFLGARSGAKQTLNYIENATSNNFSGYNAYRKNQFYASNKVDEGQKAKARAQESSMILKRAEQNMPEENKQALHNLLNDKIETNLTRKTFQESINKDNEMIQRNIENTDNGVIKKINELAPSIGQMGVGAVASAVNPALGIAYFTTSAGGSYIDDAKQRGMSDKQAYTYGTIMGGIEGLSELLGIENFKKAGRVANSIIKGGTKTAIKEASKQGIKEALKNYGIGIADNVMQEAIIEPLQELTAQTIGGKDKANWDNMGQRMLQSGFNGGLVSAIVGGADVGVNSCVGLVDKINNGQQITQQEFETAVKDASKQLDVGQMVIDSVQQQVNKYKDYTTGKTFNNSTQNILNQAEDIINQNRTPNLPQNQTQNEPNLPTQQTMQEQNNVAQSGNMEQILPTQNNVANNQDSLKGKSYEDIELEAMENYEYDEEVKSPLQNRNIDTIGKETKTNAYQYDNPKVKPYFQEMAQMIGEDLGYISSSDNRSTQKGGGTRLSGTTKAIDILHNEQGYSYNQIAKGLQNIIEDNGKENNAISKKLELIIDDQLRNGYTNALGQGISPNQEYINMISNQQNIPMKETQNNQTPNVPIRQTQNINTEQNISTTKGTSEVMNKVQDYIKNNNLDMTTDEFVEWASSIELENEENMTAEQKELYSLISDVQNRTNMQEEIAKNNKKVYNIINKSISNAERNQVDSEIKRWRLNQEDGIGYIDLSKNGYKSYIYNKQGNSAETLFKVEGSEEFKNFIRKGVEDGTFTNAEGFNKSIAEIKSEYRRYRSSNDSLSRGQTYNKNDKLSTRQIRRETINNATGDINQNSRNESIENSNKSSFSIVDNQGRQLTKQQQQHFKRSKVRDKLGRLLEVYHGTPTKGFTIYDESKLGVNTSSKDSGIGFHFSDNIDVANNVKNIVGQDLIDKATKKVYEIYDISQNEVLPPDFNAQINLEIVELAQHYAEENGEIKKQYLNIEKPFSIFADYGISEEQLANDLAYIVSGEENITDSEIGQNFENNKDFLLALQQNFDNERAEFKDFLSTETEALDRLKELGYDGIIFPLQETDQATLASQRRNGKNVTLGGNEYIVFNSNQIKNVDNLNPTDNPDIRYELEDYSDNTTENEIQRKINRSMTMEQAKDMVQRAFVTGNIYDWFDGEYKNGDEWLAGVGASDVALVIDNDFNLQNKYVNANNDIINDEYTIDDVIEAYQNGTLTGSSENQTQRLDTSKDTGYKDDRFYAPKDITGGKELYNLASQRVTNKNRSEVYKARADFIINAHNEGYIESLGLNSREVYEKLRSWTSYPKNALQTSMEINKGVSKENRWTGIENCSVVNELSVSQEQLDSLVKEIKGTSDDYQRRYISNTMLALDTHLNYKNLTFDFAPDATNMRDSVLGDYQPDYDVIRVKRDGQNTVSHEMGHYIDHLIGRELANGYNLGITRLCRSNLDNMMNRTTFTQEQKQFIRNFANFLEDIENSSDIGSSYKMSSDEVFARFVARFTEWTRNVATGNRYGYEAKWYDDHFNQSQYKEFAKLLQEYSLLKTNNQASGRSTTLASQRTGEIQDQRIEDIYAELNKRKKQQPKVPIKETSNEASINLPTKGETVNWNEIERPEGKIRKHYKSIIESSNTTAEAKKIARELMGSDTYVPESNKSQIQRADKFIEKYGVEKALDRLMTNVDNNTVTFDGVFRKVGVDDIALGERLIQYYSKTGDASNLQNAILATAQAGTDAGRAVQLLSIINHQTPTGQVTWIQRSVDKMNQELVNKRGENAPQFEFTPEMMQKILETDNQESMYKAIDEVYEELGQQVSKSKLQQIDSWRYFSMLANPKTHIRNIVGNVAMGNLQSVKNKVAGAIEGTVAQFNPNMERTHTLKRASKEVREFAKNDIKNIADSLGLNQDKYNPKSRLENSMRTFKSDAMEKTLGKAFELNEKALEVEDAWGLKSGYVKALSEYMTANKLTPNTITDAQLSKARNYAIAEAKEATFHAENAIATAINQFSKKGKSAKFLTDAVLPFVKTPMNVAKAGMEYNPTGLIKTLTYDTVQLRKGNISVNKYIDNLSKGLTGTGVAVLGYALAEAGILKASGGEDDKKEKFDEALGRQAYSLEINGKTYSLDWLAPAGIPLFVGAEAHNINKAGENEKTSKSNDDDKRYKQITESLENWANAMTNSMSPMAEMSMISGLTSALKSYDQDSTKMLGTMGTNAVKSYVNQFVPTALGQVAKTADDYERSTTSTAKGILPKAIDQTKLQLMSKIPGLRKQLPVKTDVWGKEQKQEGNIAEKALKNAILPFTIKSVNNSPVDKELNELYNKTGASSILPTTSLEKTFTIDKQTYRMTNEEYNKYKKDYGQNSYKLLDGLVSSSGYKNLTNEQKQKAIESIYSYTKEKNKVDYAKNNKLKVEPSTLYNTMEDLKKNGGNQSSYLHYIAKTTGIEKESERNKVLAEADYSAKTKSIIYSNGTGKDDKFYNIVAKNTDLGIDEYLNYKIQKNAKAFESDKDKNGKAISGSAKGKLYDYVNSNISNYESRLMILGYNYKLSNKERRDLADFINKKSKNEEEAIEIFKKLTKNYEYKNGKIYYK